MFLTNLDTVVIALFLGSGIILVTLLGILISFRYQYREMKLLFPIFLKLASISIILLFIYMFALLFRWPNIIDIFLCGILNCFELWFYFRLFSVFRQFINIKVILTCVILNIIQFIVFGFQVIVDNNLILLLFAFLSLFLNIGLHLLSLSILIKFQGEPDYE